MSGPTIGVQCFYHFHVLARIVQTLRASRSGVIMFASRLALPLVVAAVASIAGVGAAHAFELKEVEGTQVRWAQMPIEYAVSAEGARDLAKDTVGRAVKASFDAWASAQGAAIQVAPVGVAGTSVGFVPGGVNQNTVAFGRDAWDFEPEALAMTITAWRRDSGELVDADIIVNEKHFVWGDDDPDLNDLQNALTHEVGHLLGLAHSDDPEATMFASAVEGETSKRTLSADDVAGAAALYPQSASTRRDQASIAAAVGAADEGNVARSNRLPRVRVRFTGCAQSPVASASGDAWSVLALAIVGVFVAARRRLPRSVGMPGVWVAAALLVLVAQPAQATSLKAPSFETLSLRASIIVEGTVVDQQTVTRRGMVFTDTVLHIEDCLKGDCVSREVIVRSVGGVIGEYVVEAEGAARFELGERVVVFLEPMAGTDRLRTSGMALGKFHLTGPAGARVATRDLAGLHLLGDDMETAHVEPTLPLRTLAERVRATLAR